MPYFCVFKYARAVKQKVERGWKQRARLGRDDSNRRFIKGDVLYRHREPTLLFVNCKWKLNKRYDFTFLVLFLNLLWCEVKWNLFYDAKTMFKSTFPASGGLSRRWKNDLRERPFLAGKSRRFNRDFAMLYVQPARDANSEMRAKPRKALWNPQRLKRRLEHSFRIVNQLPFHLAPQQIQE